MITGEKTRIRPIDRDDLPRFVEWFADPREGQHVDQHIMSILQPEFVDR